jgi:hypothetical protein
MSSEKQESRVNSSYERLVDAYGQMYFTFRDRITFEEYIRDVGDALGIDDLKDILKHLTALTSETQSGRYSPISPRYYRIKGEFLYRLNHMTGKSLSSLEGKISKLTKCSGKGGIKNPRFPSGNRLEIALARLIATAVSDCHLKRNGTLEYFEPELSRIKRVEKNLRVFGDIKLKPKFVKRDNLYVSFFPSPLGMILQHWGMSPGDKTILNPSIFSWFFDFSWEALCAFIEDLVPQDGSVGRHSISWTHSLALQVGKKSKYEFSPKVSSNEIKLIIRFGNDEKHSRALAWGKLKNLRKHKEKEVADVAKKLWKTIRENPNNLINAEQRIMEILGIKDHKTPGTIRYHKRSGRVSVAWNLYPKGLRETIKLAIIAPPNDVRKRELVRNLLSSQSRLVRQVQQELSKKRIRIHEWWK